MFCNTCLISVLVGVLTIFGLGYLYVIKKFTHWSNKNILHLKPSFLFGNTKEIFRKHPVIILNEIYKKFVGKDVLVGMYFFLRPLILIFDPELTKNILNRDFDNFNSHGLFYNETDDPLSGNLFALEGLRWTNLSAKLIPTFTSDKIKIMFETILNVSTEMKNYLIKIADTGESIEIKDLMARFSMDVIGNCGFGIECNSIKDPNSEFCRYGKKAFAPSSCDMIPYFFTSTFPNLSKKLHVRLTNSKVSNYLLNIVDETIKFRKVNKIQRNDFIDLFIKMENDGDLSQKEISAHLFSFFVTGYETVATALTFSLYELGKNIDIQNKLRSEINLILKKYNGVITYNAIFEMSYLDKVIKETLRKYPPTDHLMRKALNDYKVSGTNHTIEKNTSIIIPIYAFHHDPDIYPEPDIFDPERFSPENIAQRHQYSYLPFGEGPRNCFGKRFAEMEIRLGLVSILKNFEVSLSEKTAKTMAFVPMLVNVTMEGGVWLRFKNI